MQKGKTNWSCQPWANTHNLSCTVFSTLNSAVTYPRINPFSRPFILFCFNFYFDIISDSCKSCKNCTKNSQIAFTQIPQILIFLPPLLYSWTHTCSFTCFLLNSSVFTSKQGCYFSYCSTTVKTKINIDTILSCTPQMLLRFLPIVLMMSYVANALPSSFFSL